MKVIEKQDVSNWNYPCTCKNCESKLEAETSDLIYSRAAADGPHPSSGSCHVVCVVCKKSIHIPSDSIPKLIIIELESDYYSRRTD